MTKRTVHNLIVVKIGSSSLADKAGDLDHGKLKKLAGEVAALLKAKKKVVIVTSGAIVCGSPHLGIKGKPRTIPEKQAAAAVGQSRLMHEWEKVFREHGVTVAQILLTRDAIAGRAPYINARNTLYTLLERGIVPVVNENDTVSTEEIKFGDNDTLSALVASLVGADLLVMLTNVDGFYMKDDNGEPQMVGEVEEVTRQMELEAGRPSEQGTGGMITKIQAAKIAMDAGVIAVIANSSREGVLVELAAGTGTGTLFSPRISKLESRKRWLVHGLQPVGSVAIDGGAETALLKKGGSLLAVGITKAEGEFNAGDAVSIVDEGGREIARGLTNYSRDEIDMIKGLKAEKIQEVLHYKGDGEVIHRDNMVIM